ncbi:MAG: TrkH family potassium uptake protein [Sedimentisphaerales bacterium]
MQSLRNLFRGTTPYQILVFGYALITITGAILLSLPISSANGKGQCFLDSLFVAVSGISTSGLSVVDIGSYYSLFGQIVLLCVFQIGGIGYMTFIVFLASVFAIRLPHTTAIVAKESLSGSDHGTLGRFFIATLVFTIIFELAGAVILTRFWSANFPITKAMYLGIFHSISTFCTAGFGLFPDSLMKYRTGTVVNFTIMIISIAGGIGFIVLHDLYVYAIKRIKNERPRRLSIHTKIALITTFVVMLAGTVIILITEKWPQTEALSDRIMASAFQSISASTTDGFNSVDIGKMSTTSLTALILLMFIGASPGSTGGGIKTTTLGLIFIFLWSQLRGREAAINTLKREIPASSVYRAFGVFGWFVIITAADMIILTATENASYLQILFETVSALGNTGLSMGITSTLSFTGKIVLIITMFIGRVGPLALGFALAGRQKPLPYSYAKEDIFIG